MIKLFISFFIYLFYTMAFYNIISTFTPLSLITKNNSENNGTWGIILFKSAPAYNAYLARRVVSFTLWHLYYADTSDVYAIYSLKLHRNR